MYARRGIVTILYLFGDSQMLKKWTLGIILLSTSLFSQADIITYNSVITGADMAGMEVTATFLNGSSETLIWDVISTDLGNTGNSVIDHEGFSGGVSGGGWSLTQQGLTLGNYNAGVFYGAWTFTDNVGITNLDIKSNNSNVVFDTVTIDDLAEDSNTSSQGRSVYAFKDGAEYNDFSATYDDHVFQELYGTLLLELNDPNTSFQFWADTDKSTDTPDNNLVVVVDEIIDLEVGEEIPEDQISGNGEAEVIADPETGEAVVQLVVGDPDSSEPVIFSNLIDTPDQAFSLNFDFLFGTDTGSLEILLDGTLLDTFFAIDYDIEMPISLFINDEDLFGLSGASLDFALYPGSPAEINLGNISVSYVTDVPEPSTLFSFALGLIALTGLRRKSSEK